MKKFFLQFYRDEPYLYSNDMTTNFLNGLSFVWNKIKNDGEMVWKHVDDETPFTTDGIIYASVWYTKSLKLMHSWAKQFPELEINVGGPAVLHYDPTIGKELPNFHFTREKAEDLFCDGIVSDWNIEVPSTTKPIGYSVAIIDGYGCYWGRCRYCKRTNNVKYRNIDKVPVINNPNIKYIWMHAYSMSPNLIKKLYPTFENRDDVNYATYIRGDKEVTKALADTIPKMSLDTKHLGFDVGIEFPSDKILQYMDKGITVNEYLDFIKLASENNIRLHFNFIVGWRHTGADDVRSVDYFLNSLSKISKPNTISANIYPLSIVQGRKIMEDYTTDELEEIQTIFNTFVGMPKFNKEQIVLDQEIINLYNSFPFLKVYDFATTRAKWRENNKNERLFVGAI